MARLVAPRLAMMAESRYFREASATGWIMATAARTDEQGYDAGAIMGGLYGDGIIALKGAFPRPWVERLFLNDAN